MKSMAFRIGLTTLVMAGFSLLGIVSSTSPLRANGTNGDYSGIPPFLPNTFTSGIPNILLLLDRGGTMGMRAYCDNIDGTVTTGCTRFDETKTYGALRADGTSVGIFDSMWCYEYDDGNTRFEKKGSQKNSISDRCPASRWDGNFLNWVALRRQDAMKIAMIGGSCAVERDLNGSCPPSGSPALITMRGQDRWVIDSIDEEGVNNASPSVPTAAGPGSADGRVPNQVQKGGLAQPPANLRFALNGWGPNLSGTFCVLDASTGLPGISSCRPSNSPAGFDESQFTIHVAVETEPRDGVLWTLGTKARWGVMVSRGNAGAIVPVALGNPQYRSLLPPTLRVTTYANNQVAVIAAIEEWWTGKHSTPGNLLWSAMQYYGQLRSDNSYEWPLAFQYTASPTCIGCGGGAAVGNPYGPFEIAELASGEDCPTAWPDGTAISPAYILQTCGRDPFFYGTFEGLAGGGSLTWSNPGVNVTCCKNAVILFTDGNMKADPGPNNGLDDYAHGFHGTHCTGSTNSTTLVPGVCYDGSKTSDLVPTPAGMISRSQEAALILQQHKTDYCGTCSSDIDATAYWAHTNDQRDDRIRIKNFQNNTSTVMVDGMGGVGKPMPGLQTVTTYVVFAFGNIGPRGLLMHAAMGGGFEDHNGNHKPDLNRPDEWDQMNNLTLEKIPDGIPDNYYESKSSEDLGLVLQKTIESILNRTASGTSISVLATSTTGEGAVYQAYFFPTLIEDGNQVDWTGALHGMFVDTFGNLREDTDGDGQLILTKDKIVKFRFKDDTKETVVDRYVDADGDGMEDDINQDHIISMADAVDSGLRVDQIATIWEAGKQLALLTNPGLQCNADSGGRDCRRIVTWLDADNNGLVDEAMTEFSAATAARTAVLCPYLGSVRTSDGAGHDPNAGNCGVSGANGVAALAEAKKIINFVRGCPESACPEQRATRNRLRNVTDGGRSQTQLWKLGDIMDSTPVAVGAPRERYDAIYGDKDYALFYQRYKDRRQVLYAGANDGMLHAFNAGFFTADNAQIGDDLVRVRFSTTPKKLGSTDADTRPYTLRSNAPPLGAELWGFVPQDLLPQLQWMALVGYDHMYYVDLKPKVTDARIFPNDADHPGGWGTVLIGGFGMGGSCSNCENKGLPRTVTADFGSGSPTTRVFLSSYFVLDITNPEKDPTLLWVFRDQDLGLTTAVPAIVRVNPPDDADNSKTSSTNERWYVMFGSGPSDFDGSAIKDTVPNPNIVQKGKLFAVDLKLGPKYNTPLSDTNPAHTVRGKKCTVNSPCLAAKPDGANRFQIYQAKGAAGDPKTTPAFMGDASAIDKNLDFRVDAIYAGSVICNGSSDSPCDGSNPQWKGAMWRLTMNSDTNPDNWGLVDPDDGISRRPTKLISTFACSDATPTCGTVVGPITAAPTLSMDDDNNYWVYFGTGRHIWSSDRVNVDVQDYFGVKDCSLDGSCAQTSERHNLYNVSQVVVSTSAAKPVSLNGGSTFDTDFDTLMSNVQTKDGWFTTLQATATLGERNLSRATLIGGTLFFTAYIPDKDVCGFSGQGFLYALFYKTGGAFKNSSVGTTTDAQNNVIVNKAISLGLGLPSQVAVQIGRQGEGAAGGVSNKGCEGHVTGYTQTSTGELKQVCATPSGRIWSGVISWRDL